MNSLLGRRQKTFQVHKAARTRHSVQSQSRTLAPVTERRLCLLLVSPPHSCGPRRWVWSLPRSFPRWPATQHILSGASDSSQFPKCSLGLMLNIIKWACREEKLNKIKEIELTAFVILDIPSGMIVKFMISGLGQWWHISLWKNNKRAKYNWRHP